MSIQNSKTSFLIHNSFYEPIKNLTDAELGLLFRAIFEYHDTKNTSGKSGINLPTNILIAFSFFKNQFDLDAKKYQAVIDRNKDNINKRWNKKKKSDNTSGKSGIPKIPVATKHTDNDNDNDNDISSEDKSSSQLRARDETDFQKIYEAGSSLFPKLATANTSSIHQWLNAGCDAELDIIPEIKRYAGQQIGAWKFFTAPIANAKATREAPMPSGHISQQPKGEKYGRPTQFDHIARGIAEARAAREQEASR